MLKDPKDPSVSPYELLGLKPDAPGTDVLKALPAFMRNRKNLPQLGQAQEAARKLQNARARAGIDLGYYQLVADGAEEGTLAVDAESLKEFHAIPIAPVDAFYTDLNAEAMRAEFRDVTPNQVKFSDSHAFDGLEAIHLRPTFDI
jgi:hypothetical protein